MFLNDSLVSHSLFSPDQLKHNKLREKEERELIRKRIEDDKKSRHLRELLKKGGQEDWLLSSDQNSNTSNQNSNTSNQNSNTSNQNSNTSNQNSKETLDISIRTAFKNIKLAGILKSTTLRQLKELIYKETSIKPKRQLIFYSFPPVLLKSENEDKETIDFYFTEQEVLNIDESDHDQRSDFIRKMNPNEQLPFVPEDVWGCIWDLLELQDVSVFIQIVIITTSKKSSGEDSHEYVLLGTSAYGKLEESLIFLPILQYTSKPKFWIML